MHSTCLCAFIGLAIVRYTKTITKAFHARMFTHQEWTMSMYHIGGQVETLTDISVYLQSLQGCSLLCFEMSVVILLYESCAITTYPLVEIQLSLNPLHLFVWRRVTICRSCAQMSGMMC